jgi:hypothetical protein
MNTEIKKFIRFTLSAIAIIVVVDFALGKVLGTLFDRMGVGEKARANYFIKKDTSDIWIFGSSHALYHYRPDILKDSVGLTAYNGGRPNQTILYHVAILKTKIKKHTPDLIVLDLQPAEFEKNERKYERLSAILPYYRYDNAMKEVYDIANPRYRYFSWSRSLPYNSSLFAIFYRGLRGGKDTDIHGFVKNKRKMGAEVKPPTCDGEQIQIDSVLIGVFSDFVKVCRENKIKLFVSVSPIYQRNPCDVADFEVLKQIVASEGIEVHDYTNLFDDAQLFGDRTHLNHKGAIPFSQIVGGDLKKLLR